MIYKEIILLGEERFIKYQSPEFGPWCCSEQRRSQGEGAGVVSVAWETQEEFPGVYHSIWT